MGGIIRVRVRVLQDFVVGGNVQDGDGCKGMD